MVRESGGIAANLRLGLEALPGADRVVCLSGDLPLLTREAVEDLIIGAPAADLVLPYLAQADAVRAYPEKSWLYARMVEGHFTGCSAALVRPATLRPYWLWVEHLLAARRASPVRLAAFFGPGLLLAYCLGRLHLADVESRVSAQFGVTARGYQTHYAELAIDVDKEEDLTRVELLLQQRMEAPTRSRPAEPRGCGRC
jgi:hypothetical protein